jgi:hypothetical protein
LFGWIVAYEDVAKEDKVPSRARGVVFFVRIFFFNLRIYTKIVENLTTRFQSDEPISSCQRLYHNLSSGWWTDESTITFESWYYDGTAH